jgi:hypothetical protein
MKTVTVYLRTIVERKQGEHEVNRFDLSLE